MLCIIEPHRVPLDKLENSSIFTFSLFRGKKVDSYIEDLSKIMQDHGYRIVDYKYYPIRYCSTIKNLEPVVQKWVQESLKKQEIYNDALEENSDGYFVSSEFWLPWYFKDNSQTHEEFKNVDEMFISKKTRVIKLNFMKTIESYSAS
jgi:hypothetical protein